MAPRNISKIMKEEEGEEDIPSADAPMADEELPPEVAPNGVEDLSNEEAQDNADGVDQATPEEQAQYEQIVAQAMNLIYGETVTTAILKMLQGEGDPIEGLAQTASTVILRTLQSGDQAGVKFSGDVVLNAGTEIFEDLANLSKEAGIKDFEADPEAMEAAYFRTLDGVRVQLQSAGRLNQDAARSDLARLEEMDKSGELGSLMRRLAERDDSRKKEASEPGRPNGGGLGGAAGMSTEVA